MTTSQTPDQIAIAGNGNRRPVLGLTLLGISVFSTISVLIFFGAWLSEDRIEARAVDGTVSLKPKASGGKTD
jgi:hypothetical protein